YRIRRSIQIYSRQSKSILAVVAGKIASDEGFSAALQQHGVDGRAIVDSVRTEIAVDAPVRCQLCNAAARRQVIGLELAAEENAAVIAQHNFVDGAFVVDARFGRIVR